MSEGDGATGWYATVWADRDYYDLVRARELPARAVAQEGVTPAAEEPAGFPRAHDPWEVALRADEVRIGRRGRVDPVDDAAAVPEIDLAGPPRDPGVSHRHAVLLSLPGERWVVMDVGSTNGTTVNYAEEPLAPDTPQPLEPGDRIHLGAWTTITVHRR